MINKDTLIQLLKQCLYVYDKYSLCRHIHRDDEYLFNEIRQTIRIYNHEHCEQHQLIDVSNGSIESGYMCVKCGELFKSYGK
jgi:hypothetical protein